MAEPLVKLISGVLYPDEPWFDWVKAELEAIWGASEIISEPVPFTMTDYYHDIAPRLFRRFLCFKGLLGAGSLVGWKQDSCAIEAKSKKFGIVNSGDRKIRAVNIDPGYVNGARLVLASTKDHAHRIYLRDGIYAEVTLRFRFKEWASFDYTFPDFASGVYDVFLSSARQAWLRDHAQQLTQR